MNKCLIVLCSIYFLAIQDLAASISSPTSQLSERFLSSIQEAVDHEKFKVSNCPYITQDLLSMTLHTTSGLALRFTMERDLYQTLAEVTHIPIVIHNIAFKYDWQFDSHLASELTEYSKLLQNVATEYEQANIDSELKYRIKQIIEFSNKYIIEVMSNESINKKDFYQYSFELSPLIEKNLEEGAKKQLEQFNNQIQTWKQQYTNENWSCLRVAILGTHGPRDGSIYQNSIFNGYLKNLSMKKM
jgi:hypothetical protein